MSQATEQSPHYLCFEASYLHLDKARLAHFDSLFIHLSRGFQLFKSFPAEHNSQLRPPISLGESPHPLQSELPLNFLPDKLNSARLI